MRKISLCLAALVFASGAVPAAALSATQIVETEKVVIATDGSETLVRTSAETVKPGDRVVYSLNVKNDGTDAATNLVLTMPIPAELKFMEGSEMKPGAVVTYSVDDGVSFLERDALTVVAIDGVNRMAGAGDISHIRWRIAGPVNVGATETLSFKGVLK